MTANQINYAKLREDIRHNLAGEAELQRHNVETEYAAIQANRISQAHYERQDAYNSLHYATMDAETARANLAGESIKRAALEEEQRANLVKEAETERHNTAVEKETARSNKAEEKERARSNKAAEKEKTRSAKAAEKETNRSNLAKESETQRHNTVTEGLTAQTLAEDVRHNKVVESETQWRDANAYQVDVYNARLKERSQLETERHNLATERLQESQNTINSLKSSSDIRVNTAKVKELEAQTSLLDKQSKFFFLTPTLKTIKDAADTGVQIYNVAK